MSHKIVFFSLKNIQRRTSLCCTRNLCRRYHPPPSTLSPQLKPNPSFSRRSAEFPSELGLRSHQPPDSSPQPNHNDHRELSDQEWEIRIGRAIYVLQNTLPDFFTTGLITSIDKATGSPQSSTFTHIPIASANPLDYRTLNDDLESIYSPRVRLLYTPPVALPAPFPKTLHIEGLPLYLASSVFVRHSLNALYSDLHVTLRKVTVRNAGLTGGAGKSGEESSTDKSARRKNREKSLFIALTVTGTARVSGGVGIWEVDSTYTFSPITGLILTHTVDSIHPAPHQAVYGSLRASLGKAFGLGMEGGGAVRSREGGTVCEGDLEVIVHKKENERGRKRTE